MFWICRRCDRSQRYCGPECRQAARRLQLRQANRRHQSSDPGRQDHRDHQRAYRQRARARATGRVTYQGSLLNPNSGMIRSRELRAHSAQRQTCMVCGCRGEFVNPFPFKPKAGW